MIDTNGTAQIRPALTANTGQTSSILPPLPLANDIVLGDITSQQYADSLDYTNVKNYVPSVNSDTSFGDGRDGDVIISANTNLTKDMYYNNLTVNAGITLTTGNFNIYIKENLINNGKISADYLSVATINSATGFITPVNGVGGIGAFGGGNGGNGTVGNYTSTQIQTCVTVLLNDIKNSLYINNNKVLSIGLLNSYFSFTNFGVTNNKKFFFGGASGLASNTSNGTTGGGLLAIFCKNIQVGGNLSAIGSDGLVGSGGNFSGAGGGGVLIIVYKTKIGNYTGNVSGGTNTSTPITTASSGNIYEIQLT